MLLVGLLFYLLEDKGSDTLAQLETVQLCLKAGLQCRSGLKIIYNNYIIIFFLFSQIFLIDLISISSHITIKSAKAGC